MIRFERLNPEQRAAVEYTEGPLLILAGAGSGKTRVLTCRVAHLIDMGVRPWKILAITFTNKAAAEMRERVTELAGEAAADTWVSTFHSACARILRRDIEKLGYKRDFTIYDEDDRTSVIKRALKDLDLDEKQFVPRNVRAMISDAKNRLLTPEEWLQDAGDDFRNRHLSEVYRKYEETLASNNALDFDDLLVKTLVLLTEHPPVLQYYRDRFDYILVDEYQDTNLAQYQLVRQLAGEKRNLCVVGDDDQSIYGWRGADIRNILEFEKDFPDCKVIKLEQNYRSTSNILDAANQVIAHNAGRKEKALWTDRGEGDKVRLYHAADERDEASFIGRMTRKLIEKGTRPGEIAVLYRTNAQSRVIEEEFVRAGVPHRVYGGQRFYDRKEVKDIIAYMRALVNPDDDVSVRRVINEPKRGIGDTTIERLIAYGGENGLSLMSSCLTASEAGLNARATKLVDGFSQLMIELTEAMYTQALPDFVETVLDKTGYIAALEIEKTEESAGRIDNLREFQGAVSEYAEKNPEGDVSAFLENVALISDIDNLNQTTGAVTLMTLHSAKGLEFDAVFLAGMEDGVFPLSRALLEEEALEEERRLMYVGITRAKKQLYLIHARTRLLYNARSANPLSRFVDEIPRRLIEEGAMRGNAYIGRPPQRAADDPVAPRYDYGRGTQAGFPGVQKGFGYNAPRPQTAGEKKDLRPGDRVKHGIFGAGIVTDVCDENGVRKVTVAFANGSKRRFSANVAPITKIED